MTKIRKKLKDNTGASMILVLVLFFLCVMVSSIIVATASTGASRNVKRKQQAQNYLSVMSAANLVAAEMRLGGTFVGKTTLTDYGCNNTGDKQYEPVYRKEKIDPEDTIHSDITASGEVDVWEIDTENTDLDGMLKDVLLEACTKIFDEKETRYETTFSVESTDDRLVDVQCKFVMDNFYNIAIYFSTDGVSYAMTLKCDAQREDPPEISTETEEHTHDIIYTREDEITGELFSNEEGNRDVGATITTIFTEVTWNDPVLRKGED